MALAFGPKTLYSDNPGPVTKPPACIVACLGWYGHGFFRKID